MIDELDIAIIGMNGRFPGAKDLDEFWQNLQNGIESIAFFTDEELDASGIESLMLKDPNYVRAKPIIEDVDLFDASFFGLTPKEAEVLDPQNRLFLECAWEALEVAGYASAEVSVGVYAGASMSNYLLNLYSNPKLISSIGELIHLGNVQDGLSTRVSYKLNLKGPSYTIQTACSTSLVAVHVACQSLLNGECDIALAGGVTIKLPQKAGYKYQKDWIESPDGHCRAFDALAQGTVLGSGLGIVVLKRLEEAIADGDCVHAVIKGSATNNDGSLKVSYAAPSVDGQAEVIAEALADAGIAADTVTYVETHGTGTSLGDPIEVKALTKAFRVCTQEKNFCAIGSVKTNVGHLDRAAGVASLIKTVLALKHGQIPPSLHFKDPNPEIDFANSPFYVNTQLSEWKANGVPRRAGVSSFGIGGTNAHVILEEAPPEEHSGLSRPWQLLLISAKTSSALETATENLAAYIKQDSKLNLADVAYTLQVGRRGFDHRRMVVCRDNVDALEVLETLAPQRVLTHFQPPGHCPVVFMFPGQGSQYVNMARDLYESELTFQKTVDACCEQLKPHLGLDLRSVLFAREGESPEVAQPLQPTQIAQPALFTIEYALAQLWMSWGVQPEAMIGHSIGEYVAACLAGVFSLEDALAIVAARGRLMQQQPAGAMLSVQLPDKEVEPLLGEQLALAGNNAPSSCVVSGCAEAIEALEQKLLVKDVGCRRLQTSHGFHSPMMESIVEPFIEVLGNVRLNPPCIPFISNVSGSWITAAEATDPHYWASHLRQTVRFSEGLSELLKESKRILLEVGPGRTLSTLTKQHQADGVVVLTSMRHPQERQSDVAFLLNTLGVLWLRGVNIEWSGFYANERRHRIPVPTYPFERQRYWIDLSKQVASQRNLRSRLTASELWQVLVEAGQRQACNGLKDVEEQAYLANMQWLDRLCIAYMNLTLRRLGAFSNPSERYSVEELSEQFQIIPRYRQLLCRWLDVLVERGQLRQEQGRFTDLAQLSTDSVNVLTDEVKNRLTDTYLPVDPALYCGDILPAVLTGEKEPLELYVAQAKRKADKKAENSAREFSLFDYFKAILWASLKQVSEVLPSEVKLRILEIGGGNGIATTKLLPMLSPQQAHYTFTDVGGLFLKQAQQKFKQYPFVDYRLLDIEQSPQAQGFESHCFDVVIAVNVLHVTRRLDETLEHVRSLLAPGGFLLLWEVTQPQLTFDVTEGLLMNPLEDEERSRGNPFLSKAQWQEKLHSHGFVEVVALSETEAFGHHVLAAQASASATYSALPAFTALADAKGANETGQVPLDKKSDIADWFYLPSWKRSLPPQSFHPDIRPGCWLVFVDECGLGEKLVQQLVLNGQEAIAVKIGNQFSSQNNSSLYTISPQKRGDYDALLTELRSLGKLPKCIVHCWSVTLAPPGKSAFEHLEKLEHQGFYSLLLLAQALGEQNPTDSVDIRILSNNVQDVTGLEGLCPEKALILGPCRVIPLEYSNITCRSIDIILPDPESWQEKQLINHLLAELTTPASSQIVAYRGNHRWVRDFEPVRLEADVEENPRVRQGGVYLITGGLGGVGLVLAEYLAQSVQAKLILIGRSAFPDRDSWDEWLATHDEQDGVSCKIRKLQALEALGAEVMVVSADVTSLEQMSAVLESANQQFSQVHGVIHAAAVLGGGMIQLTEPATVAKALAPKVQGTRVLERLFKETELDFFVLCSSLSSLFGTPGMVDYTAENVFLDAFAHASTSQNGALVRAIDWDRWVHVGMAIDVEVRHKAITGSELTAGMTVEEGIEAFRRILCSTTAPQLIVSTQDLLTRIQPKNTVKSWEDELAQLSQAKSTHPRPNLGNAYVAPRNEVEQELTNIWQQLLGLELVGVHDSFFELGGDSLFATQLVSQLCKTFQIELPYKSFFNAPTIAELAEVIVRKLTEEIDPDTLTNALEEIEQLSEEEAQTILTS